MQFDIDQFDQYSTVNVGLVYDILHNNNNNGNKSASSNSDKQIHENYHY